ncbi:DNA cytosine methyltransferase [Pseudomonas aeruginosa]|nr:DNA cytosine methyltransferase [Pseudomonas aeruginosa]MBX5562588.1 DNA cytosine methyltransferase [Pseudomonas aeruginosa]MBX5639482.1 DNA cytosine methyltransferase [Pseudomonas aeruginosa]MBX5878259.1 DNA cytosine methyltransferase [Pseudomonas aeruginosa]MBX5926420.1 DNA cytosine methyltransferase [Pseudomonas aeruginosa]
MNWHITYGSVCSGIEAASVAWHMLGFRASWFAEIEPFPSAVLAHRWPAVPNLGDMTKLAREVLLGIIAAPLILVGGTPCQDFSVAGMRAGLAGERGALTMKFVELADAIDHVRPDGDECVVVWENVPGVLSDKGNAFGNFLAALVGESEELQPPGGKWKDAGCVYGPKRTAAWRILDAQYFGLAQRRRRVFVIASARADFDPAAVLFEREGMRRDHPPRRGEGQDLAGHAPFGPALQCGCGYLFDLSLGQWGCPNCEGDEGPAVEVMAGVPAFGGENQSRSLFQAGALTAHGVRNDFASETFCVHGTQDLNTLGDMAHTLGRNSGQENAVFAIQAGALRTNPDSGPDGVGVQANHAYTLEAHAEVQAVAVALRGREHGGTIELGGDVAGCLRASSGGGDKPHALVHSAVRRLTPRECERLQGFPDDYTLIPWRGKPAEECPDGPRYKSIGNSKAVPVVRWIARRLKAHLEKLS